MGLTEFARNVAGSSSDCQYCADNLLDYEDGLLSDSDAVKIKAHLEECAECRCYQHALREGWKKLELAFPQELEPDPNFKIRFWKTVGQGTNTEKLINLQQELSKKSRRLRYWSGLAAVASFALVSGAVMWTVAFNGSNSLSVEQRQADWTQSVSASAEVNNLAQNYPVSYKTGSYANNIETEPYYTEYVVADEFSADHYDWNDSFTYTDYEQDFVMSQELLDMAFNEAAGIQD
ncbi:MAG: anti-sigma factor family protein [Candidatus Bruticola sp.]